MNRIRIRIHANMSWIRNTAWKEFKSAPRNVKTARKRLDQYLDPDSEKILRIRIHTNTEKNIIISITNLSGLLQKCPDGLSHSEALGMKLFEL